MRFDPEPQPITETDVEIAAALAEVDTPPLLAAVACLTGDFSILRDDLRPTAAESFDPTAGISPEQATAARRLAAETLGRYRDAGNVPAPPPDAETIRRTFEFLAGAPVEDDYATLMTEELAIDGVDRRAPEWTVDGLATGRSFRVGIIGAGMSGIVAAHRLGQAGVEYQVFEKNADVGGTWLENRYPGCRVDVPNHFYSYSFAQTSEWPQHFSTQPVLLDYFRACADEFGIRPQIRFETEVVDAVWSDEHSVWNVTVRDGTGAIEAHEFDALVSSVGQLNRPKMPDIPGVDRFAGDAFHSARWDESVDLTGKRVAIIGTGASAAQFIPVVGEVAGHLTVFQRTPPWLLESPNYHDDLPVGVRWLLDHVPGLAHWDRVWIFWRSHEVLVPMAAVDESWDSPNSVSLMNDLVRGVFTEYYKAQFPDPDLFAKLLPDYPPFAKRFVRDNGIWARTFARDNVELVVDGIAEITERGVAMVDGTEHEFDVIIYGTGFQASSFLTPMTVRGVGGRDLHAMWDGEARAYLGMTIPDFPNLFLMYGPNTNIVINGSIIYFSELEARYIVESVRMLLERGAVSMDVRPEVHDEYNRRVDAANTQMAWGAAGVNTWYKNASGRITQNWPFSLLEFWQRTRHPDPDDYVLR
ncbi:MAG: NAD(P)/FAD-dependent oxidoreductase [Acidimicrobiia bacterium]|nr:NAD(P)/FAD-dependent oxidoreductase [Acidimicrobiia bacterium]